MAPELRALVLEAWAARFRQPLSLRERGAALAAAAPPDSPARAWGAMFQAMGLRAVGEPQAAAQALAEAAAGFEQHGDTAGRLVCQAQRALSLAAEGQGPAAEALIGELIGKLIGGDPIDAAGGGPSRKPGRAPAGRSDDRDADRLRAYVAQFALFARKHARGAAGRWDDALRDSYAAVRQARTTGDDAAIAHALADLASVQGDLSNAEDALALAIEAEAHGQRAGRTAAWQQAAFNRLSALLMLQRFEEAAAAAGELLPQVALLSPRNREAALVLLARARLHGGDAAEAQALLDRSVRERTVGMLAEWTIAQAEVHLCRGEAAAARDVCEGFLAGPAEGRRAVGPDDLLLLHRAAAQAQERLGDAAAALRHARAELALTAQVLGRAARARRVALDIEHQVSQERWQREQAQQRQQASEAERARLDEMNRALEAANAAKTRFLAAASHDLRQPVQALALNMAALEHEPVTPAQAQLVQRMGKSLQALSKMFDVLLDISRLDAGAVPVAPQPLALRPFLHRLHDELAGVAAARGLRLRLRLPAGEDPCTTQADPVLLERCLRNLLDNAIKYTPRGGILLALRGRRAAGAPGAPGGPGAHWQLQVRDTGIGMTPEVQARAFDEFYQADNPERDRARGLGLGLPIVQRLARLMGHALVLRSEAGRGTCVMLSVPWHAVPAAGAAPLAATAPAAAAGLCVAVLDDDAEVREGLQAVLVRWGHDVLAGADDAALLRAWRAASGPPVQAIVTDLRLRGTLTGVAAVAALRQAWQADVPALVITGDVAPERLQLLRAAGLPWLPKPVMPMRLRSWLAQAGAAARS